MIHLLGLHPNVSAFLETTKYSELKRWLLDHSDDGYDVIVGSHGPITKPDGTMIPPVLDLMTSYADHPRKLVHLNAHLESTAAGAFQILTRFYDKYKVDLVLPDFGPEAQERIALQMMHECHAIELLETGGHFDLAVHACSSRWASLPGNSYGQHQNSLDELSAIYAQAGGR